jgi:hypothetical protein
LRVKERRYLVARNGRHVSFHAAAAEPVSLQPVIEQLLQE